MSHRKSNSSDDEENRHLSNVILHDNTRVKIKVARKTVPPGVTDTSDIKLDPKYIVEVERRLKAQFEAQKNDPKSSEVYTSQQCVFTAIYTFFDVNTDVIYFIPIITFRSISALSCQITVVIAITYNLVTA